LLAENHGALFLRVIQVEAPVAAKGDFLIVGEITFGNSSSPEEHTVRFKLLFQQKAVFFQVAHPLELSSLVLTIAMESSFLTQVQLLTFKLILHTLAEVMALPALVARSN